MSVFLCKGPVFFIRKNQSVSITTIMSREHVLLLSYGVMCSSPFSNNLISLSAKGVEKMSIIFGLATTSVCLVVARYKKLK